MLNKLLKYSQPRAKSALQTIWIAEIRADAERAFNAFVTVYEDKYPKAVNCLTKDRAELLTFYGFPGAHWQLIRTTDPIESTFATARLRTAKTRGCVSRDMILRLTFKLSQSVAKRWRRLTRPPMARATRPRHHIHRRHRTSSQTNNAGASLDQVRVPALDHISD